MADELFDLRNSVTLGNFHQAIAEGSQIKVTGRKAEEIVDIHAERDLLIARAQVGLGQQDSVIAEHRNASHPLLRAAHAWATFHKEATRRDDDAGREASAATIKQLQALLPPTAASGGSESASKPAPGIPATIVTMIAACHMHRDEVPQALQLCGTWANALEKIAESQPSNAITRQCLELRSICVEALLRMNRVDLADKMLQDMRQQDDDAVITMLAGVSVAVAQCALVGGGGNNNNNDNNNKAAEAKGLLQDLTARCGQSVSLLNISAVASLLEGKTQDCETSLVASLGKRSTDVDTLSNLAALAATLSKPTESFQRLCSQATASHAEAAWPKQFAAVQQRFRDSASAFAATA